MQVGILTMHRVLNYGSFMQGYALKSVIESFGHDVRFMDFQNGQPRHRGQKVEMPTLANKLSKIPGALSDIAGTVRKRLFRHKFNTYFRDTCWNMLGVPEQPNYSLRADAVVIGSDEVFNYTQNHSFGYVPALFGHGIEAPLILSYAPSAGYANWTDAQADGIADELRSGLQRLSHISVRDENTRRLVELCTGNNPTLVVDPTLIYDFDHLLPAEPVVQGRYMVVYAYEGRMDSPQEIETITAFARKHGLKLVTAGSYHGWCDENLVVSPFELLRLFKDAEYVVTDTFHGSIFAMKHGRQFATFLRGDNPLGSNANKVSFLLHQLGMQSRIVSDLSKLGPVLETPAPYDDYRARWEPLRDSSLAYLRNALT
ncbi:hypothetical protein GJ699_23835 [Duganella sp. FT80W]|uniref:Polysaccharide pyruvyl transferase domain-containing protein n=1 Tax=Duganella guangzhouensis TaxID=2666084 RepID=A0A6I2L846_9BURK|nr:polysaccharide pyruvyl transferase family protein [Duganella guangzhouensis]MRW93034.1 hypothetical protein [Duganella guangzhouensis]